jgi:hypothetical protein
MPEIFKYPFGTVDRHREFNNTKPGSQDRQILGVEQFLHPIPRLSQDKQFPNVSE